MNKFARLAAFAALALGANAAWAIPLQVNVSTLGAYSTGTWALTGTESDSDSWTHVIAGSETWNLDVAAGEYDWNIWGSGALSGVTWSLNLAGQEIFRGVGGGLWSFRFSDDHSFDVVGVPEPATLGLLGMGLLGVGFAARRRRAS